MNQDGAAARRHKVVIRPATVADLDRLTRIEAQAFSGDQLDRRAFRHAIGSPSMTILVAEIDGAARAYAIIERRRGSRLARLTSIAVDGETGRRGLGGRLLAAAEEASRAAGCERLRLEVRADNMPAIALYERDGYARFDEVPDYYEDGAAACRFEKTFGAERRRS